MRNVEHPVETPERDGDGVRITHPAFAQIGACRVSGQRALYGSDFLHQNYITITISASELTRKLSTDWTFGKEELIEVAVSEAQWATFVSSMNIGSGVQCTLTHRGRGQPQVPYLPDPADRRERFAAELAKNNVDAAKELDELRSLIVESKLSGKAATEMLKKCDRVQREIGGSQKFVADMFDEHMENTVEKAKIEVNAYATRTLLGMGLDQARLDSPIRLALPHDAKRIAELQGLVDQHGTMTGDTTEAQYEELSDELEQLKNARQ